MEGTYGEEDRERRWIEVKRRSRVSPEDSVVGTKAMYRKVPAPGFEKASDKVGFSTVGGLCNADSGLWYDEDVEVLYCKVRTRR
jgi:hypothetical protein